MKHGLILAYGQEEDGELKPQTIARLVRGVTLYRRHEVDCFYLTTAAGVQTPLGMIYMADKMKWWLHSRGVPDYHIVVAKEALNTAGEIEIMRDLVPQADLLSGEFVFVTTEYHHIRVEFLAKRRFPYAKVSVYSVTNTKSSVALREDVLQEYLKKLPGTLLLELLGRNTARFPDPAPS